jgi:catechol 2,3-dioxygenase
MKAFLPDQTRVSQVHLRTANLEGALAFYSGVLGLTAKAKPGSSAALSAGPDGPELIVLIEDRKARPRPPQTTGLFHSALRYPQRQALAQVYRRVVGSGYEIDGASDHGVSEAIYLADPDGNGVELYADRPSAQWPRRNGQIAMVTGPLNLEALLASVPDHSAGDSSTQPDLGHIHLEVSDLAAAERFYSEFLGFSITQRSYPGALFFAAGGYHHHIAVNTWAGRTVPPAGSVGLISYRLEVPVTELLYCLRHRAPFLGYETRTESQAKSAPILQIRDPNGTCLEVQPSPNAPAYEPSSDCSFASTVIGIFAALRGAPRKLPAGKLSYENKSSKSNA